MHLTYRNINSSFLGLVTAINNKGIRTVAQPSRYGDVIRIPGPVTLTYLEPRERVLFNKARDCNPFFHLFESLWMLAGRNDVAPLAYYNSKMADFSDDGKTYHAAYGYRWSQHFAIPDPKLGDDCSNQLKVIIEELKADPTSRRLVLQMWDTSSDLQYACTKGTKDVPCNLLVMFEVDDAFLNMTVINRSNDMVWGSLGANFVQFSMLQEYMACCIGLKVGQYHQISNNLHVYTDPKRWTPKEWLAEYSPRQLCSECHPSFDKQSFVAWGDCAQCGRAADLKLLAQGQDPYVIELVVPGIPLIKDQATFDTEVKQFIDSFHHEWKEPFLQDVAKPMCQAFAHHKARNYETAMKTMALVRAQDWRLAGTDWLNKRKAMWEAKQDVSTASAD